MLESAAMNEKTATPLAEHVYPTWTEELIARAAHECVRAYCEATGRWELPAWLEAPQWMIDSAVAGVRYLASTPLAGPERSHRSWVSSKYDAGWRFGPVRDLEARLHPLMLPWEELPPAERAKDEIFVAVVRGMLAQNAAPRPPEAVAQNPEPSAAPAAEGD
jgi:hypothetical protein